MSGLASTTQFPGQEEEDDGNSETEQFVVVAWHRAVAATVLPNSRLQFRMFACVRFTHETKATHLRHKCNNKSNVTY